MAHTVRLTIIEDEGAADIVCGVLRANGIACAYRMTDLGAGFSEGWYSFGGMREILVDETDLSRARELLDAVEPVVEQCVRCGRPIGDDGGWFEGETGELAPYCGACAERAFGPD